MNMPARKLLDDTDDTLGESMYVSGKKLSSILRLLMLECGNLKESDITRHTKLPQATVNRILQGDTNDPRLETLRPIAKFFGITIGQLVGDEPLSKNRITGSYQPSAVLSAPILDWKEALHWTPTIEHSPYDKKDWIVVEDSYGHNVFALKSLPSMEPLFPKNSTLIIDAQKEALDGSYVVISTKGSDSAVLRKVAHDGSTIYLKAMDSNIPSSLFDENTHRVIGTVTEVRLSF